MATAILSGCSHSTQESISYSGASSEPTYGDAYIDTSIGDASYLNPILATDSASGDINGLVFNGLVKYDRDLHLIGDLAESWQVTQEGRLITFQLRRNVLWHDGEPFTSQDVLFTYKKLRDPDVKTPYGADFELVQEVTAPDDHTVRIFYREPFAPALESWSMGIIPHHIFQTGDFNSHPANRHPIGTGPYKFLEWRTDEQIVLEPNLNYFEGRPYLQRYLYRIIPDQSVQFLHLRQASVDAMGLTPDQYYAYPEFFTHYNKFRYPAFAYTYLGLNLKNPLFKNQKVRKAIAHAINKKMIIQGVLRNLGRAATGPFPPSSWAYDESLKDYEYSPSIAKELLKEAGWSDIDGDGVLDKGKQRFQFTIVTNQGNKLREQTATIIQQQLKQVGLKVDIRILEWSSFIHNFIDKRAFEATILGWRLSRDPDQYTIWHSGQTEEGQYNFVSYANPEVDRLLDRGRRIFNLEERKVIYQKIHRILFNDLPYVFLYYPEALPVVHKRFVGPEVAAAGIGWNFREWFVPHPWQKYQFYAG